MDPESSPKTRGIGSDNPSTYYNRMPQSDDPWYSSGTGSESPTNDSFGYSNFTPNAAPVKNLSSTVDTSMDDAEDYSNELPLLEELGIRFDHIWSKTQAVILPTKTISEHILDDADLAGPLVFCLLLGACLLLSGKVSFGYIYGFSVCGCIGLTIILNLMHATGIDLWRTCSVLGYCLLPVIGLAGVSIVHTLRGPVGLTLAVLAIAWSTLTSTRLLDAKLHLTEQFWLVAYPVMLLYSCFVLITIF